MQELEKLKARFEAAKKEYYDNVNDGSLEGDIKEQRLLQESNAAQDAYNSALKKEIERRNKK